MKNPVLILFVIILTDLSIKSQNITGLDETRTNAIIDSVIVCFRNNYVDPEIALNLTDSLNQRRKKGEYSKLLNIEELLSGLSSDIRNITQDKHIRITFIENSDRAAGRYEHSILSNTVKENERINFNFRKVEWLPGNIGYLRFDIFEDPDFAGDVATSAINFINNCDAIIIDLRYNGGGEENMVRYLSSYFFPDLTLLNTFYFTRQDSIVQSWTDGYISGKKLIGKNIYILTSPNTASAAEAFTYILKNYKQATIIGEKTSGAAHWVDYFYYPSIKTEIKLPVARPISPITKSNWEKTGIMPDVVIPEYLAYYKAYYLALEKLQNKCTDKSKLNELDWYKRIVNEKLKSEIISTSDIIEYIGEYDGVSLLFKNNYLFWHQEDNSEFILLPISKDHFVFDDSDDYIVRFVRDAKEKVTGYQLLIKNREKNPIHAKTGKLKIN